MRIQEINATTTCAKMTEEKSMNGDISSGLKKEILSVETNGPASPNLTVDSNGSTSLGGGRLRFFKDGKFILELSHRKDNDRGGYWVPVPKKTYWPAVGTFVPPGKHESSTTLSVSDDNSSVQSSPWQRDHCWKQSNPRRNMARGMEFYFYTPRKQRRTNRSYKFVRRKQRSRRPDSTAAVEDENDCTASKSREKIGLSEIVKMLMKRTLRLDPGIVSPRKRILREMERVTIEEQAKRQRARTKEDTKKTAEQKPPSHSINKILSREEQLETKQSCFLRNLLVPAESPLPSRPPTVPFLSVPPINAGQIPSVYSAHPSASYVPHPSQAHFYSMPVQAHWYHPVSSLPRAAVYGGPLSPYPLSLSSHWSHITPRPVTDSYKRDDVTSDVPLNLSKNGGG